MKQKITYTQGRVYTRQTQNTLTRPSTQHSDQLKKLSTEERQALKMRRYARNYGMSLNRIYLLFHGTKSNPFNPKSITNSLAKTSSSMRLRKKNLRSSSRVLLLTSRLRDDLFGYSSLDHREAVKLYRCYQSQIHRIVTHYQPLDQQHSYRAGEIEAKVEKR